MAEEHPDTPFKCPDPMISNALTSLLEGQQQGNKKVGKIEKHLETLNHRTSKLEIQNIKEATRNEVNKEWQNKENDRIENKTEVSQFRITTILAAMTLISSGIAIAVTQLL